MAKEKSGDSGLTEAAKKLGKRGGEHGGPARAKALTPSAKKSIAKMGGDAKARKQQRS